MNRPPALSWTALFRRGLAAAACLLVLFATSVHVHAEPLAPSSITAAYTPPSQPADTGNDALPCLSINHHCCEAASLPALHTSRLAPASAPIAFTIARSAFPEASGQAPPAKPPRA